jgi:hypothetical protein
MFVFVEDAAEAIMSADRQVRGRSGIGDRGGQWVQGPGVGDPAVWAMSVVVPFVLVECVQQMWQVPDQRAVQ